MHSGAGERVLSACDRKSRINRQSQRCTIVAWSIKNACFLSDQQEVTPMIRLKELQDLIRRRLDGALPPEKLDRLNKEIERLDSQWEEINMRQLAVGSSPAVNCLDCWLEEQLDKGVELRLFFKGKRVPP
jgi:hypothetical protein